jgi:hypothetical protein
MRAVAAFSLIALMCACCAGLQAEECADWSRTPSLPHVEPSITGNVCRLDGSTAYVAGAEFMVVDVSVWDRPLVTGRVVLPAAAQDLAIAWPKAWVACGEAGIIELDIADSATPAIVRVYDPARAVTKVIEIDGAVIALDAGSQLHFLEIEAEGPLVARSVRAWRTSVFGLTKASGYLVVGGDGNISVVDVRHVTSPVVTSTYESAWWPQATAITADRDRVVVVLVYLQEGSYVFGYNAAITTYIVTGSGLISMESSKNELVDIGLAVAAGGGWLMQTSDDPSISQLPGVTIRDIRNLDVKLHLPLGGRSLDRDRDLLVSVGAAGLSTVELPPDMAIPPAIDVRGDLDPVVGPGFSSTTYGAIWKSRLGVLTTTKDSYSGASYDGGVVRNVSYTIVDGHDPATWPGAFSGSFRDAQYRDSYCSLANLSVEEFPNGIAALTWGNYCSLRVTIVDVIQRCIRGHIDEPSGYQGAHGVAATGRILWVDGATGTRCFDATSATPSAPINTVPLVRSGLRLAPDEQLLVVYDPAAHEFDTYDMTDVNDVRYLATWKGPTGGNFLHSAWIGRRLACVTGTSTSTALHVVDFSEPAAPVHSSTTMLPRSPKSMSVDGARLVFDYEWTTYAPTTSHRQFQVADISGDGSVALHAAWEAGAIVRSHVQSGNVLYADHGVSVRAYDLREPGAPVPIGAAVSGGGPLAVVGDYLASGSILTPRDCRDLRQPRAITIDVQPALKPGSPSGYDGPALIAVIVRGAPDFDPAQLDPATVRFGPSGASPVSGPTAKAQFPAHDDVPGPVDARFRFRLEETGITSATDEVRLTGRTFPGVEVLGVGHLNALPPGPAEDGLDLAASPNPFNPRTTLSFSLGATGTARLVIYNLQGQRVRSLLDGLQPGGRVVVVWDGTGEDGKAVASGVYFARLASGGRVVTQRLALVR